VLVPAKTNPNRNCIDYPSLEGHFQKKKYIVKGMTNTATKVKSHDFDIQVVYRITPWWCKQNPS